MEELIWQSLKALERWVKSKNYIGWDPYDGLNNPKLANLKFGYPYLHIFLIQFNKHFPFNIRNILQIREGLDNKGLALFLQAYSMLYSLTGKKEYKKVATTIYEYLLDNSLIDKYGYHCWASHYYPYVTIGETLSPMIPDIIGTSNVIKGLSMYYLFISKKNKIKKVLNSNYEFLRKKMLMKKGNLVYFLYTPRSTHRIVPDASAEALEAIYYGLKIYYDPKLHEISKKIVETLIKLQNSDGSWPYAIYNNGKIRQQIDFHHGYIIDGLLSSLAFMSSREVREAVKKAILRAVKFYEKMFLPDGRAYYRYPRKYPTDIHNQAQGIITFSKLYRRFRDKKYLNMAEKIARWTVENMQDETGYFYYKKGRIISNKIPYMRWNQAWMMVALSTLLKETKTKGTS